MQISGVLPMNNTKRQIWDVVVRKFSAAEVSKFKAVDASAKCLIYKSLVMVRYLKHCYPNLATTYPSAMKRSFQSVQIGS